MCFTSVYKTQHNWRRVRKRTRVSYFDLRRVENSGTAKQRIASAKKRPLGRRVTSGGAEFQKDGTNRKHRTVEGRF